jgi:hypothetical protein
VEDLHGITFKGRQLHFPDDKIESEENTIRPDKVYPYRKQKNK